MFVDAVQLTLISTLTDALNASAALPTSGEFVTSQEIDETLFSITFAGENLLDDVTFEGRAIEVGPPAFIPLPAGLPLLAGALGLLTLARRRRAGGPA